MKTAQFASDEANMRRYAKAPREVRHIQDTKPVLQTLRESYAMLLATYKARPTPRNRANVLAAKQAFLYYKEDNR